MEKEYQKLRASIFRYVIWLILFWGLRALLSLFQIEYRLWLSALGYIISTITPFILFRRLLIIGNQGKEESRKLLQAISLKAYNIFAYVILFFAAVYGLFTMNEENITEDGKLEVAYGVFLSENYWYPFEKISFWGRTPAYGQEAIQMLEEKYDCKFRIDRASLNLDMHWIKYVPDTYPDLRVTVYGTNELIDDFSETYIGSIFSQVHKELGMESNLGYQSFGGPIYHTCLVSDWNNPTVLVKNAALLISRALEKMDGDVNAPCTSGVLYVVVKYHDQFYNIPLPFGDSSILQENRRTRDYYISPEHVYEEITLLING